MAEVIALLSYTVRIPTSSADLQVKLDYTLKRELLLAAIAMAIQERLADVEDPADVENMTIFSRTTLNYVGGALNAFS